MFCSACGKQVDENLNFCHQCGARIGGEEMEFQSSASGSIPTIATGVVGMFGLFGFVFLTIKLLERNLGPGFVFMLLALYAAAVLGTGFLLFKQSADQSSASRRKKKIIEKRSPKKLSGETFAQLSPSYQSPVSTVTERTTRSLDEVLVKRE